MYISSPPNGNGLAVFCDLYFFIIFMYFFHY